MSGAIDLTTTTGLGAIGPRLVAQTIGVPYDHYRPAADGAIAALDPANKLAAPLRVWLTVDPKGMATQAPVKPLPIWYGSFDPAQAQVGDYIVGPGGTYFISTMALPAPMSLTFCSSVVTVTRRALGTPGPSFRGGVASHADVVATQFPCFIGLSTRRDQDELHLPGAIKAQNITLALPPTVPGELRAGDMVETTEAPPKLYTLQGASLGPAGWAAAAIEATG